MVIRANIIKLSVLACLSVMASSCRKVFHEAEWEPEAIFPIAYTDLTLKNILTDTSSLKTDSTGLARLVFEQKLDSLSLNVLDTFSAPPFYRNFKLDSLRLEVPPFTQVLTIGQLARQLKNSGDPSNAFLGDLLLALHGTNIESLGPLATLIPATISVPLGKVPIDLNQFFESALLRAGTVDLTIRNEFPMKVNQLDFNVANSSDSAILLQETGIQIEKGTTFAQSYDLAGKTVEGKLDVNVSKLELLTDRQVIIDTNQFIKIDMVFSNLQVISATAVFPNQDVVSDRQAALLEDMGEMELKEAIIQEGNVVMEVISTLQDSIFMTYEMPKTTYNGMPLVFNGVVPPAIPGQTRTIRLEVPVSNYNLNLSSPPEYFNRFVYDFKARVKYTGKKVYLSLQDSIVVNVYMKSIRPRYVRGYLGSLDTSFVGSITTDAFSKIKADQISPATVEVDLRVTNSLGVGGSIQIDQLRASAPDKQPVDAQDANLIGIPLAIQPATDNPLQEKVTLIKSSTGSNFPDLISIFPDRLDYKIKATVGGLPKDSNSFVYNTSKLKSQLEITVPLHLSVQGLLLRDTVAFSPSSLSIETAGGALNIVAYNGFPFNGRVKAVFTNASGQQVTLNGSNPMLAAEVDPSTGKVQEKKYSKITLPFTQDELYSITQSQQVILEAKFDTPEGQKVKLYSSYSAQLTLTAKVAPKLSR